MGWWCATGPSAACVLRGGALFVGGIALLVVAGSLEGNKHFRDMEKVRV